MVNLNLCFPAARNWATAVCYRPFSSGNPVFVEQELTNSKLASVAPRARYFIIGSESVSQKYNLLKLHFIP